jgi:hypothetical protein
VPNNVWGWGKLDAQAAVEGVTGQLRGTVTDASTGSPIAGAEVTVDPLVGPATTTDHFGQYTLTVATDIYSVTADALGFIPQTITNVVVVACRQVTMPDIALVPAVPYYLPLLIKSPESGSSR